MDAEDAFADVVGADVAIPHCSKRSRHKIHRRYILLRVTLVLKFSVDYPANDGGVQLGDHDPQAGEDMQGYDEEEAEKH